MSTIQHSIRCNTCYGQGQKSQGISKRKMQRYEAALKKYQQQGSEMEEPVKPKSSMQLCPTCGGTGLMETEERPIPDTENYPHIAIIGAGIGGVALALACLHRQIPFTLFERDRSFDDRSQGYGLTLQQASKEMKKFGINAFDEGIVSTLHLAHNTEGEVIGKWGLRNLENPEEIQSKNKNKSTNIHIARQSLRLALLNQLGGSAYVQWNHQLIDFKWGNRLELTFEVDGISKQVEADLLVGADGIRSAVRRLMKQEEPLPLRYLGCIVILGICKLSEVSHLASHLLDGKTVFQTANGNERMYMMPYDQEAVMWQFSFPMDEESAKGLSKEGADALKQEVIQRTQWHSPIPEIIAATETEKITGYPVYDRDLLTPDFFAEVGPVTLLGDAAHPMSPFKGQGANQALLDALLLARKLTAVQPEFRQSAQIRQHVLASFEQEMIERSSVKVKQSAEAAKFLHSEIVLEKGNVTFGSKWSSTLAQ